MAWYCKFCKQGYPDNMREDFPRDETGYYYCPECNGPLIHEEDE